MKLSKNSFYKSWAPKLIFSNPNLLIWIIFDDFVRILQFGGSNNFDQKCSKKIFKAIFVISGVLASVWKVFIKFIWHGQNTIYGPFGQSSKCSTLDFGPRLARKETNVPLYREAKSLLCMIKVVDVYNQRFLHIFFIAYQTNWFDFSKLDALEAPNLHEKLLISFPSNYHAICELWKLRRIFIELSQMIYFEFKSFLKKHYCF